MTMTELRKTYPAYFASKNKIELTPAIDVDKVLREMKSRYANEKVNDADGVKIEYGTDHPRIYRSENDGGGRCAGPADHCGNKTNL